MDLRRQPGPKHRGRNDIVGLRLDDVSFLGQQDLRRDRLVFLIAGNPSLMMEGEIDNVERRDESGGAKVGHGSGGIMLLRAE